MQPNTIYDYPTDVQPQTPHPQHALLHLTQNGQAAMQAKTCLHRRQLRIKMRAATICYIYKRGGALWLQADLQCGHQLGQVQAPPVYRDPLALMNTHVPSTRITQQEESRVLSSAILISGLNLHQGDTAIIATFFASVSCQFTKAAQHSCSSH